jgi:hypothetical protein
MSLLAPLRVPVEIRAGAPRWFRLAHGVSEGGLAFPRPLPEELEGAVEIRFHLPEDPAPIEVRGRVIEVEGERSEPPQRRGIRFLGLDEDDRARIARYVEERVPA